MRKFDVKKLEQKISELEAIDGITLAIWGIKPDDEKYVVNFDIGINTIFDLLSFTEYDVERGDFDPDINDIFIIDTFYDCICKYDSGVSC